MVMMHSLYISYSMRYHQLSPHLPVQHGYPNHFHDKSHWYINWGPFFHKPRSLNLSLPRFHTSSHHCMDHGIRWIIALLPMAVHITPLAQQTHPISWSFHHIISCHVQMLRGVLAWDWSNSPAFHWIASPVPVFRLIRRKEWFHQ